jgi:4-deoxy-L-threo-5-hexosulose-uronate ketol-isomerase
MHTHYDVRYATHAEDARRFDTEQLRHHFLLQGLLQPGQVRLVYSHYDRLVVGGAVPVDQDLPLEAIPPLRAASFLDRREMGVINVGGSGVVVAGDRNYELAFKEALYLGRGTGPVVFKSRQASSPARFYLNSAPAHAAYPAKKVSQADAVVVDLGSPETSNQRRIFKLLVDGVIQTCQLQMGMTELRAGSVWNTMPPHVHDRRMEAYFYFEVPEGQAVCHFMGEPQETRHLWLTNEQAVLSPDWSIHSAAGTANYTFIWGMAGENLDYGDMDTVKPGDLR